MKRFQKGFTLVEIIMVLGIASLITAAVFIAVTGAQRSARDTTRRADTQKLATAIEQWSANNNGALPTDAQLKTEVVTEYLDSSKMKDPQTGEAYNIYQNTADPTATYGCGRPRMLYIYNPATDPSKYYLITCLESGKYTYTP
jgi:prepilin-type N-terminal cleavage/methylation domain-containing protein